MSEPLGPVVITAREIYDQQVRLVAAVERLVDRLDEQQRDLRDHQAVQQRTNDDHEARLRRLESGRWPLPSLAALLALASLVLAYFKR